MFDAYWGFRSILGDLEWYVQIHTQKIEKWSHFTSEKEAFPKSTERKSFEWYRGNDGFHVPGRSLNTEVLTEALTRLKTFLITSVQLGKPISLVLCKS